MYVKIKQECAIGTTTQHFEFYRYRSTKFAEVLRSISSLQQQQGQQAVAASSLS